MARYIELDALLAEIDRRIKILQKNPYENHKTICHLDSVKQSCNTLEAKEVDLDKEVDDYINEHFSECDDGVLISDANSRELTLLDITPLAKHFFELGMNTSKGKQ